MNKFKLAMLAGVVVVAITGCGREPVVLDETNTYAFYNDFGLNIRMIVKREKKEIKDNCPEYILVSEVSKYIEKDPKHRDPKITCSVISFPGNAFYFPYNFKDGKFVRGDLLSSKAPTIPIFEQAVGFDKSNKYLIIKLTAYESYATKVYDDTPNKPVSVIRPLNENNQMPLIALKELENLFVDYNDKVDPADWRLLMVTSSGKREWFRIEISEVRKVFIIVPDDSVEGREDKYFRTLNDIYGLDRYFNNEYSAPKERTTADRMK
ncbi:hypothetical protein [Campylobacter concisus]|uniref:hypothetical protein n=1 Tax=Campylobacter concisus TaxID=199 RepID=UPI000D2F9FE4|nr:hypothetical protein [Campylobacter concisus]